MSQVRYLLDEHVPAQLKRALSIREPTIDVLCVGDEEAPPKGTLDPELLLSAESAGRLLVTSNRRTIPEHLRAHFSSGHSTWGIFMLTAKASWSQVIDELIFL